jgi:cytochrome c
MTHSRPGKPRWRAPALIATLAAAAALSACTWWEAPRPVVSVPGGDVERGEAALLSYGCVSCHTIPGIRAPNTYVGPPLTAWANRRFIAGNLSNEPDNLVDWIMNPQAIEPGTAMPPLGVSREDALDMAAYLYTLKE